MLDGIKELSAKSDKDVLAYTIDGLDTDGNVYPCSFRAEQLKDENGSLIPGKYEVVDITDIENEQRRGIIDLSGDKQSENLEIFAKIAQNAHTIHTQTHNKESLLKDFDEFVRKEMAKLFIQNDPESQKKGVVINLKQNAFKSIPVYVKEENGELSIQATAKDIKINKLSLAIKYKTPPIITKMVESHTLKKGIREICALGQNPEDKDGRKWLAEQLKTLVEPDVNGNTRNKLEIALHGIRSNVSMEISYDREADKYITNITRNTGGREPYKVKAVLSLDELVGNQKQHSMAAGAVDREFTETMEEVYTDLQTAADSQIGTPIELPLEKGLTPAEVDKIMKSDDFTDTLGAAAQKAAAHKQDPGHNRNTQTKNTERMK